MGREGSVGADLMTGDGRGGSGVLRGKEHSRWVEYWWGNTVL